MLSFVQCLPCIFYFYKKEHEFTEKKDSFTPAFTAYINSNNHSLYSTAECKCMSVR